jgi:hypothetical protein
MPSQAASFHGEFRERGIVRGCRMKITREMPSEMIGPARSRVIFCMRQIPKAGLH